MLWNRFGSLSAVVAASLIALVGCKSGGSAGGDPVDPPAVTDPDRNEDRVWTPEVAADSIAEAAATAAKEFVPGGTPNPRQAIIDAATEAAVDQAMLVAPDLGIDSRWVEAINLEIRRGVVPSDVPGSPDVVLGDFIQQRVRARTLEWIQSPPPPPAPPQ
jgi:nitroreductase